MVRPREGGQPKRCRRASNDGLEVEVSIGDVEGNEASRRQLSPIERERRARQEMGGDGIGAESVENQDAESSGGGLGQSPPCIANDEVDVAPRVGEVCERTPIAGYLD